MAQSKTNRDLLIGLIRSEVDKAIGRVSFVREDELAALRARVEKIEAVQLAGVIRDSEMSSEAANAGDSRTDAPVKKKKKVVVDHES